MVGTELHSCDEVKALFKSQNWLAEQDIFKNEIGFFQEENHVLPAYF